jgi:hypothetical protein
VIDKHTLYAVIELHEMHLPRAWIAWALDIEPADVSGALKLVGVNTAFREIDAEKYVKLALMINDRAPLGEIVRTLHMDHRTIYHWFPEYKPLAQGHSPESKMIRDGNKLISGRGGK